MSETTYTPGPWHFDERQAGTGDTGSVEALTPDGKMVTREICTVLFDDDDPSEDAANARLIAAAPALLAACKAVAEKLDYIQMLWGKERITDGIADAVRSAISKAESA